MRKNFLLMLIILYILVIIVGCGSYISTINKEKKAPREFGKTSYLIKDADDYFWDNFHRGDYQNIDMVIEKLARAYNEDPNDLKTVAHLGFAHAWALSERRRSPGISARVVDHATLAVKYFGEAYQLNTKDPRIMGFLADFKMAVGSISQDAALSSEGFFDGLKSIRKWPEFNEFTIGYIVSQLPPDTWQFKRAVQWQWNTLAGCSKYDKFDKKLDSEYQVLRYSHLEGEDKYSLNRRTCWNTWIVPHNIEGFLLNMGDMLTKAGKLESARKIYEMAKTGPGYDSWPFKEFLVERIKNIEKNVKNFNKPIDNTKITPDSELMLVNSSISCQVCHKRGDADIKKWGNVKPDDYLTKKIYFLK